MAMNTLKDLYVDQAQDMYSANKQSLEVTKKLHQAAKNDDLKSALKAAVDGIEDGMAALSEVIKAHDAEPSGEHCRGMEGLVKEAEAHALEIETDDDDVRDASIITQYQRMCHYAIAGYGCLHAFAHRLKLDDEARRLKKCLDNTYDGDRHMTDLAMGGINEAATR